MFLQSDGTSLEEELEAKNMNLNFHIERRFGKFGKRTRFWACCRPGEMCGGKPGHFYAYTTGDYVATNEYTYDSCPDLKTFMDIVIRDQRSWMMACTEKFGPLNIWKQPS